MTLHSLQESVARNWSQSQSKPQTTISWYKEPNHIHCRYSHICGNLYYCCTIAVGINSLSYSAVACSIRSPNLEVHLLIIFILCSNLPLSHNSITGKGQVWGYVLVPIICSTATPSWYAVEVIEIA